ncbi:acyltransferase family protein [Acetobacter sp. UBA5411]|uniref:acyltransferase family protein n=1 Tax=Acetobacter sp. UBA5411 TaxID=1945905 RepID=UPI0025B8C6E0|nr:acyltransferase [Acetobacter sp. UBA5411]
MAKLHKNSFGFLRLFFAFLVIVSHTPELKDGNRSREILTSIFGSLSFGEVAVDGFFIISGYFIVTSFIRSSSISSYFIKRIFRIYPGYIASFIFCLLIVGPLAGTPIAELPRHVVRQIINIPMLRAPILPHVFDGQPYPSLNGAMWSLSYEFSCYVIVVLLGLSGIFKRSSAVFLLIIFLISFYILSQSHYAQLNTFFRLCMVFMCGAAWAVAPKLRAWSWTLFFISSTISILFLFLGKYAEIGLSIFGSYSILSFGFLVNKGILTKINNKTDISYGVYLYAWPIEKLIFLYFPTISLISAGTIDFLMSALCAIASWHIVERPMQKWSHKLSEQLSSRPLFKSPASPKLP